MINFKIFQLKNSNYIIKGIIHTIIIIVSASLFTIGQTTTFNYTKSVQTYTVPPCVTSIIVDLRGAEGGTQTTGNFSGKGGRIQGTFIVIPGEVLYIYVGGMGMSDLGGWNGGGGTTLGMGGIGTGAGGGGASDIRRGGTALIDRMIVAAGGGGAGGAYSVLNHGGDGGGLTGMDGYSSGSYNPAYCGGGATQTIGGSSSSTTRKGKLGIGGDAGAHSGGGGGGYYGGGGGTGASACCSGGGGGGGSSFAKSVVTNVTHTTGFQNGNGQIMITENPPADLNVPGHIFGPLSVCAGSTASYFVDSVPEAIIYNWIFPAGTTINYGAGTDSVTVTFGAISGNISVTAENACASSPSNSVFVDVVSALTADAGADTSVCLGSSVLLNASGGSEYSWSPSTGLNCTDCQNPVASPTINTDYIVTVFSGTCDPVSDTVTVRVKNIFPTAYAEADTAICRGDSIQLFSGGGSSYKWFPVTGLNDPNNPNTWARPLTTTRYTVTVTNAEGCSAEDSVVITVNRPVANAGNDISICAGSSVMLKATGGITYRWSPTTGLSNPDIANPIADPNKTTIYEVTVTDINNCTDTDQVLVTVNPDPTIYPVAPVCNTNKAFNLKAATPWGKWSGPGITNANSGLFDPYLAGIGIHKIAYTVSSGFCTGYDSLDITVSTEFCDCNLDFERGSFDYWTGYRGTCCPVVANNVGIVTNRHTIMSGTGTDTRTGGALPVVPPGGGTYTSRLGNDGTGSEAEKLTYKFTVTPENEIFGFQYAVVLQDGGHLPAAQARFAVSMLDAIGDTIPCGTVDFIAIAAPIAGFLPSTSDINVQYKPWSTAVIDLRTYLGQAVTIEFHSGDCSGGAHFGYGYIDGLCEPVKIQGNYFCAGDNSVTLSVLPGFLSYEWNTSPPQYTQSITIDNPADGATYSVTLTPTTGAGCPVTLTTTLNMVDIVVNAGPDDTICSTSNYPLAAKVSEDSYHFSWQTSGTGSFNSDTVLNPTYRPSAADISAGSVKLTITASDSTYTCSKTDTMVLNISKISLTASSTTSACRQSDGEACVVASGGILPYSYLWNDANKQTSPCATGLGAGVYKVTVTEVNNCSATTTVIVNNDGGATVSIDSTRTASCSGTSDGAVYITVTGDAPPFTYEWSNGAITEDINNLPAGMYYLHVTDTNFCNITVDATVEEPLPLSVMVKKITHIGCNSENSGAIDISVSGGTWPYRYVWSNSEVTEDINQLSADTYSCTVTDNNGCDKFISFSIEEPPALDIVLSATDTECGRPEGSTSAHVSGGTAPYSYSWNTASAQLTATAYDLVNGNYKVTVKDMNGCIITDSIEVRNSSFLSLYPGTVNDVLCYGECKGSAEVIAKGIGPFTYTWNTYPQQTTNIATGLCAGKYKVEVENVDQCRDSMIFEIGSPKELILTVSGDTAICKGASTKLTAVTKGGTPPYTFKWTTGESTESITVLPAITETYSVTVIDSNDCGANSQNISVKVHPLPSISFTADPANGCAPLCVSFANSTPDTKYAFWEFGDSSSAGGENIRHCYHNPGTYSVSLEITDTNDCINTLFKPELIKAFAEPIADFSISQALYAAPVNNPVQFKDQSLNGDHWLWNFGDLLSSTSSLKDPSFIYSQAGAYTIDLVVTNDEGCSDTVSKTINIEFEFSLYIPNAFTPDEDGLNDYFSPKGIGIASFEMAIYNRWGEMIYHATDIDKPWNGKIKDSNDDKQDVYIYKIQVTDIKGELHAYIGNVTMLR